MWNKHDDINRGAQPDFDSEETPDLASLGDALVQSLMNEQVKTIAVVPQRVPAENHNSPSPPPSMKKYTEAVKEFTENATAFIEHLSHLTKARAAYEEAMRASAEIRKVLDTGEKSLRTLMTQVEQGLGAREVKPAPEKRSPEPIKLERMGATDEGGRRATKWP